MKANLLKEDVPDSGKAKGLTWLSASPKPTESLGPLVP